MSDLRTHLMRLLDHMIWADREVAASLEDVPVDDRAREIYAHVIGAEQIWLNRILGEPDGPVWPAPDDGTLIPLREDVADSYRDLLQGLTVDDLHGVVRYRNSAGREFGTPVLEILAHVFLHGAYHRGQVALLLRDGGSEPAPSDFIGFVRGAPAATREDAERRRQ